MHPKNAPPRPSRPVQLLARRLAGNRLGRLLARSALPANRWRRLAHQRQRRLAAAPSELQPPHISGSLETRFAWAYNRAALAMLSTSVTTTLAFTACAVSEIWDIRCFGVVNGFMVLFDYLLVVKVTPVPSS